MPHPILIPSTYPLGVGRGDSNGNRCRYQPIRALEQACHHLAFWKRMPISGWTGKRIVEDTDDLYWRSYYLREQFAQRIRCRVWYSTSTPLVTATFRAGTTEEDANESSAASSIGDTAEEAICYQVDLSAGTDGTADAGLSPLYFRVSTVVSSDPDDAAPTLTVWSVKWYLDGRAYLELP